MRACTCATYARMYMCKLCAHVHVEIVRMCMCKLCAHVHVEIVRMCMCKLCAHVHVEIVRMYMRKLCACTCASCAHVHVHHDGQANVRFGVSFPLARFSVRNRSYRCTQICIAHVHVRMYTDMYSTCACAHMYTGM
eukprot:GHVS01027146.1.p3 GENE.GHVS01027146.1~~GHVS01027146.1.p3  ORF type:complete len:136 (+),score=7.40 GHVS01027146.1:1037-1444(+)